MRDIQHREGVYKVHTQFMFIYYKYYYIPYIHKHMHSNL